jgi:hypothetical protein
LYYLAKILLEILNTQFGNTAIWFGLFHIRHEQSSPLVKTCIGENDMKPQYLLSVAALLASSSLVAAQQSPEGARGGNAPAASDSGSAGSGSAGSGSGGSGTSGSSGATSTDANRSSPGSATTDSSNRMPSSEQSDSSRNQARGDRGDSQNDRARDSGTQTDNENKSTTNADRDNSRMDKSSDNKSADKGGLKNVTPENKTRVKTTFSKHKVEPAKNINVDINVGVTVPRSVRFYPIPDEIVVIAPAYRSYRYFMVEEKIVIVDPNTYEVVDVIIV